MVLLGTSGLVAAYVVVALLLLVLNLNARWSWTVKAIAIAVVSALYLVTYYSIPPLLGWPTDQPLPKRFLLLAAYVQEPDKASGRSGQIVLWAADIAHGPRGAEPRAYRLAFSPALHEKVNEAEKNLKKNLPQIGEVRDDKLPDNAGRASAADGEQNKLDTAGKSSEAVAGGQNSTNIDFFDSPDFTLPNKQ